MESSSDSGFLPFFLFIVSIFVIGKIITYFSRKKNERRQRETWEKFAREGDLEYSPAALLDSTVQIKGHYRDHDIKFFTTDHKRQVGNKTENYICTNAILLFEERDIDEKEIEAVKGSTSEQYTEHYVIDTLFPKGFICRTRKNYQITIESGKISYKHEGFERNKKYLTQLANMLCDLAENCPKIIYLGGEVVPVLQEIVDNDSHSLDSIAIYLLKAIASRSRDLRKTAPNLLCPCCLVRYELQKIRLPRQPDITYFACQRCHQNREYFAGEVVVLLDNQMEQERLEIENTLKVNWFAHQRVFDFDAIEVEQATDEEVERFAVQIGNDTNETRSSRYEKMCCIISPTCELSENTKRILEHLVGSVEMKQSQSISAI